MEPGWKIEYFGGQAVWTARPTPVTTVLTLRSLPPVSSPAPLRQMVLSDRAPLKALYAAAFADCIEFCDCDLEYVRRQGEQDLDGFFAGKRGPSIPEASFVACEPDAECLAGAILVRKGKRGRPVSELLFVAPAWQRKKVGTALMTAAADALNAAGHSELVTSYALGNEASRAFYHRFGFVDFPSGWVAQKYLRCVEHELHRHAPGELSMTARRRLKAQRTRWKKLVTEWESLPPEERWRECHE
jgi:GNAT superfamily N-acetyltransferase